MKFKLIAVLIAITGIFMSVVLWRTDSFVYGDRLSWVEAQTRTQTTSINHALAVELKSLQKVMGQWGPDNFQKNKINWSALNPYFAVATLSVSGNDLQVQNILVKENSKAANWGPEFVKSALGALPKDRSDLRYFVKPFQDNQRGRYVAVVLLESGKAYALFGTGETFQALIDAQRGSLGSFSIVTTTGLTVGHTIPEYLGTVMRDDPLFQQAQKGASSQAGVIPLASGDKMYGMYEEIPRSNLWVMSSSSLKDIMKGRLSLLWQFVLLGVGLVLVGLAAILFVVSPEEEASELLQERLALAQLRVQTVAAEKKSMAVDPEQAHKDKLEASMRVASALAHEMRGPLAAILGYSQMIHAQSPNEEVVKSTDSILRETRAARDVLDKLLGYAGETVQEKNSMSIEGPLAKALKPLEPLFQQKGIKVTKKFQETAPIALHVDALAKAFAHILSNSVEAMERMSKKEVIMELFEDADGVHLTVSDTGEGIESANLEKIFDPFFTTRSFHNHMGLGLSLAYGIIKEHNATVNVESKRGEGTKVSIVFKKSLESDLVAPAAIVKEEVIVVQELPQLKQDSSERQEAEEEFVMSQPVKEPESPLNMNIDKLLEFPEDEKTIVVANEFEFIDGFMEKEKSKNSVREPKDLPVTGASAFDSAKLEAIEESELSTDQEFGNKIVPPRDMRQQKTSRLDSYQVDIRRPGKRI